MNERMQGILQIVLAVFIIAVSFYFSANIQQFKEFGYVGVFLISLLSSATIFIPAPGWAVVVAMGRVFDPYVVGIIAGIGGGLGEITGYGFGAGASQVVKKHLDGTLGKYKNLIRKYDLLAIGALAFIPNPLFDVAGLAAGSMGIDWKRFIFACIIGRILRYVLLAYVGAFSLQYL